MSCHLTINNSVLKFYVGLMLVYTSGSIFRNILMALFGLLWLYR